MHEPGYKEAKPNVNIAIISHMHSTACTNVSNITTKIDLSIL